MPLSCRRGNPLVELTAPRGSAGDDIARDREAGTSEGVGDEVACTGTAICSKSVRLPTRDEPERSSARSCRVLVPRPLWLCTTPERLPGFSRKTQAVDSATYLGCGPGACAS